MSDRWLAHGNHPMSRLKVVVLSFIVCANFYVPAMANTGLNGIVRAVTVLDTNFDIADKNHDGLLSREEAANGNVSFIAKNFDAIDGRHRGLVSKDEVHDFIKKLLMRDQHPPASASTQR
ncbi:hypothetical protein [Rhodanobacter sp. B05]|jgi:hypothetical protein|uniref:hypothetical protein n=1 Tax=Rhodanobacter sp. B05 TaxID=1945859 RepID=UPI0011159AF2|nr:hypothetical protein [Rhodanobacter sp. B05]